MKQSEIIGYRKFTSKAKKPMCVVTVVSDYSDRELEYGAVGKKSEDIWIPADFQDEVDESCIGRELQVSYYRNGDRFFVDTIDII